MTGFLSWTRYFHLFYLIRSDTKSFSQGVLLDSQPRLDFGDSAIAHRVETVSVMQPESNENPGTETLEKESSPTSTVNAIHISEASGNSKKYLIILLLYCFKFTEWPILSHATRDGKRSRVIFSQNLWSERHDLLFQASLLPNFRLWRSEEIYTSDGEYFLTSML